MHFIVLLFILFQLFGDISSATNRDYDAYIERLEAIQGETETLIDFNNLKLKRRKKEFFCNGTFTFHEDLDNSYTIGTTAEYSPMGNNQFIKHPFRIPIETACESYNTTQRKYIEPMLKGKTDFPLFPPEGICPIPKGTYYIKDLVPDLDIFPQHVPRGLWKIEETYYKNQKVVGGLRLFLKCMNK